MIAVCGEALIDLVPSDDPRGSLTPRLGGAPFNVAVGLGRLGAPTTFISRISTDTFGSWLMTELTMSRVDTSLVQRGPELTSLAVPQLDHDGVATYQFYLQGNADQLVSLPAALPDAVDVACFGAAALAVEPAASVYETLLRRESANGRLIVLDPNVREPLIEHPDDYRRRFASWLPDVGLLKLSVEDATWLSRSGEDPRRTIVDWQAKGPAAVVLTRGPDDMVVAFGDGRTVSVPVPLGPVVDTIGAGDSVLAALLARLSERGILTPSGLRSLGAEDWRDALAFAASAAAVTCGRAGADLPWAGELALPDVSTEESDD